MWWIGWNRIWSIEGWGVSGWALGVSVVQLSFGQNGLEVMYGYPSNAGQRGVRCCTVYGHYLSPDQKLQNGQPKYT